MGTHILEGLIDQPLRTRDGRARAELTSDGLGVSVTYCDGRGASRLVLQLVPSDETLTLNVPDGDLRIVAQRGSIDMRASDAVSVTANRAEWRVGSWRLTAAQIVERAETMIIDVEKTLQTRAERIRSVARGMFQVMSERTSMRSKENTAIDGKRILLG